MKKTILIIAILLSSCTTGQKILKDSRKAICRESCTGEVYKEDYAGQTACLNKCD